MFIADLSDQHKCKCLHYRCLKVGDRSPTQCVALLEPQREKAVMAVLSRVIKMMKNRPGSH